MSLSAFMAEQGRLLDAIGEAKRNQATHEAAALADELRRLERDHPQPWERMYGMTLEAANAELERLQTAADRPRRCSGGSNGIQEKHRGRQTGRNSHG
jgi:hypothetical protein